MSVNPIREDQGAGSEGGFWDFVRDATSIVSSIAQVSQAVIIEKEPLSAKAQLAPTRAAALSTSEGGGASRVSWKIGHWVDHYHCYRCNVDWTEVFVFGPPKCPACNKRDQVSHTSSEWVKS